MGPGAAGVPAAGVPVRGGGVHHARGELPAAAHCAAQGAPAPAEPWHGGFRVYGLGFCSRRTSCRSSSRCPRRAPTWGSNVGGICPSCASAAGWAPARPPAAGQLSHPEQLKAPWSHRPAQGLCPGLRRHWVRLARLPRTSMQRGWLVFTFQQPAVDAAPVFQLHDLCQGFSFSPSPGWRCPRQRPGCSAGCQLSRSCAVQSPAACAHSIIARSNSMPKPTLWALALTGAVPGRARRRWCRTWCGRRCR